MRLDDLVEDVPERLVAVRLRGVQLACRIWTRQVLQDRSCEPVVEFGIKRFFQVLKAFIEIAAFEASCLELLLSLEVDPEI